MDFDERVEMVHAELVKDGYQNSMEVCELVNDGRKFTSHDRYLRLFGLDEKLPNIVSDEEFSVHDGVMLFSGAPKIKKVIDRFQKGHFKTLDEHKHGFRNGLGYYFTDNFDLATSYADDGGSRLDLMVVKLAENARIWDKSDFDATLQEYEYMCDAVENRYKGCDIQANNDHEKRKRVVMESFYPSTFGGRASHSLITLLHGYDGIFEKKSVINETVIFNRDIAVQPSVPVASHFM